MKRVGLLALLCPLWGCSVWVASGFDECELDADCGAGRVCSERYCFNLPEGCDRSFGAVDHPGHISLGATLPFTSGALDAGIDESEVQGLNAIVLALDEVNQREGVGGRPFALYVCNTGRDSIRVQTQATFMAEVLKTPAVFTSGSGQALAASTITVPRDVLLMTATATSPELTSLLDTHDGTVGLVWRTAPSDELQGRVIADLISTDPLFSSVSRLGVLYVDDPYGQGLKEVIARRYTLPGKTLRSFQYTRGADVLAAVNGLATFAPELTVLIGFPDDVGRIITAAAQRPALTRSRGHRWFFTDSAKDPALLASAPSTEIASAYGTAPAQGAGLAFPSFRDRYLARYAVDPNDFSFTSHSYDAMWLLALGAAFAAGSEGDGAITGPRIAGGLTQLSSGPGFRLSPDQFTPAKTSLQSGRSIDVEGTSGKLDFDATTGEATSPIELWQVTPSGFSTVRTVEPPL